MKAQEEALSQLRGFVHWEFKHKELFEEHRRLVREMVRTKKRLKNPVNLKSGKPLSDSTINGLETKIVCLKNQISRYRLIIKWARLILTWRHHQSGYKLSVEDRLLIRLIVDYAFGHNSEQWYLEREKKLEEHLNYWKGQIKFWKELCDHWKALANDQAVEKMPNKHKKRKIVDSPFKVIDGGMKFEERPPFVNP